MGVVYYANYLRYFESARASYMRSLETSNSDLLAWGLALPVADCACQYRRPARYEDLLDITLRVTQLKAASLRFDYEIHVKEELIATGHTRHASVDPQTMRPKRLASGFRTLIETDMAS